MFYDIDKKTLVSELHTLIYYFIAYIRQYTLM